MASQDLVAHWDVPLHDRVHNIEFEHGTTTGKRVVRVDGQEIVRREWMFKLVGSEIFKVGTARCEILVIKSQFLKAEILIRLNYSQVV